MTDFECYVQVSDGFPKKVRMVGGWGEFYPVLFWIFGFCLTLQSPLSSCEDNVEANAIFAHVLLQLLYVKFDTCCDSMFSF